MIVSGASDPRADGTYAPILDDQKQIDKCNGMPKYECRDCDEAAFLRLSSVDGTWTINGENACTSSGIAWVSGSGSPTDPTANSMDWGGSVKVVGAVEHKFEPAFVEVSVQHLGRSSFKSTDMTSVVISGTVSHAGFHAAYFAEGCPHKKSQYVADPFDVSGSTDKDGTYELNGMCESLPYYKCVGCSSGTKYIWYYPTDQRWHIGSDGCGSPSAEIRVDDANADLEAVSGTWEEWDGSSFVSKTAISVTTVKYFVVSGSTNHDSAHGTYRQLGECSSVASFKCDDCGGDQYIWYDTGKWYIGSDNCGTNSAEIRVEDQNADLEAVSAGSWEEDTGSGFATNADISVTALTKYPKVDTEECMCPADGVKVWIERASGSVEPVTVTDGEFSTPVFEGERVKLGLKKYYGVEGNSDCEKVETRDFNPEDSSGDVTYALKNLHCIELPDKTLVDVLEVDGGTPTCGHIDDNSCPAGYNIWVPRSYEHADAVYNNGNIDPKFKNLVGVYREQDGAHSEAITYAMNSDDSGAVNAGWRSVAGSPWFLRSTAYTEPDGGNSATEIYQAGSWITMTGWDDNLGFQFDDAPILPNQDPEQCFASYLCSSIAHEFSVTKVAGGTTASTADGQEPTFEYTADVDAEVRFLDTSTQKLSATYVVGANQSPAEYVTGVPVVAKVERCGWERPAWALRGVATFELGATAVEVRALGDDEVEEAKYYHPSSALTPNSNADDCDSLEKEDVVEGFALSADERTLRGCRAKILDLNASATERLPCATSMYEYVDEMPSPRIFDVDLSTLTSLSTVTFGITSPLCLKAVSAAAASGTTLQGLVDST